MSLIAQLKQELGTRNVAKYYPNPAAPAAQTGDLTLAGYIAEGMAKLAERKPLRVTKSVVVASPVQFVDVPTGVMKVNSIWIGTRKLIPGKTYEVYAGDQSETVFDVMSRPDPLVEYPDSKESATFGEWIVDAERNRIEFAEFVVGTLTVLGFGYRTESEIGVTDARSVLNYAMGTALINITPVLLAKMDIDLQGLSVKQKTSEYKAEGESLIAKFEKDTNVAYIGVA